MSELDPITEIAELRQRLAALEARLAVDKEAPVHGSPMLECLAGNARVGLPLAAVEHVMRLVLLTPLPEVPFWVAGTLHLAGGPVPVIDVTARLTRAARSLELNDLIVVVGTARGRVGLIVQEVLGLTIYDAPAATAPAPVLLCAPYVVRVMSVGTQALHVLSVARLVELSELPETTA